MKKIFQFTTVLIIFILTFAGVSSYNPVIHDYSLAPLGAMDGANDWLLFQDISDLKLYKIHPNSLGGGDNLGNHTATQDLAMSGFNITVPDNTSSAFNLKITGTSTNFLSANSTDGAEQTSVGTTTLGSVLNLGSETTSINGSQKVAGRTITASGTQGLAAGDYYVRLDATTGAKTITLPTVTGYFVLKFKRVDNNPGTAIIFTGTVDGTVNPNSTTGGSPIAALATQYASLTLIYNGSSWDVAD